MLPGGPRESGCLDTGCPITMGDRRFQRKMIPNFSVKKHVSPVTLRGIGQNRHSTDEVEVIAVSFLEGSSYMGVKRIKSEPRPRENLMGVFD